MFINAERYLINMRNKILALFAVAMMSISTAYAEGITSFERLLLPDYWTSHNKNGDQLLMDNKMIKDFNASIRGVSRRCILYFMVLLL